MNQEGSNSTIKLAIERGCREEDNVYHRDNQNNYPCHGFVCESSGIGM